MSWLAVSALGGLVGVDATTVAQTMISRPIIAATLTGVVVGRPAEALFLGAMLELFALVILPVGAARYPESGTAAVAAFAAYAGATPVMSPAVADQVVEEDPDPGVARPRVRGDPDESLRILGVGGDHRGGFTLRLR